MSIKKLLVVFALASATFPLSATAAPSEELKAELQGYVDSTRANADTQATFFALMTQGLIGGDKAKKELASLAKDERATVRLGAGMGLVLSGGSDGEATLVAELLKVPQLYTTLSDAVTLLPDDQEVVVLKALIKSAKPEQLRDIFRYLAAQHGAVYGVLGESLVQKDAPRRAAALEAALFTAHQDAAKFAGEMLKHKDEAIRADGIKLAVGLAESPGGSAKAIAVLEDALKGKSPAIAGRAARYLAKSGHKKGVDYLANALSKEEDAAKKLDIATFLVANNARVSTKVTQPLRESENEELKSLGWQLAAVSGGAEVLNQLIEMFGSTTFSERIIAVKSLGRTGSKKAVKLLSGALFEGNRLIRLDAARGLGSLGKPGGLAALDKAIKAERDREVKIAVIEAVSSIKSSKSLQLLRFQSTARDPEVKFAVVRGMRKLGDKKVLSALTVLRRDRDIKIQWQAFLTTLEVAPKQGLGQMSRALRNPPAGFMDDIVALNPTTRLKVLEYLLRHGGNSAREKTLMTVERLGDATVGLVRKLAVDPSVDEPTRVALVKMLSAKRLAKDQLLFEKLVRASAASPMLQHAALAALVQYTSEDLGATFRGLLGKKDPVVKAQAAYGLAAIN